MGKAFFNVVASSVAIVSMLSSQLTEPPVARAQAKTEAPLKLKVGDTAPDFTLKYFDGTGLKDVRLSDYRGKKNVVLAFYIFAFTGG